MIEKFALLKYEPVGFDKPAAVIVSDAGHGVTAGTVKGTENNVTVLFPVPRTSAD